MSIRFGDSELDTGQRALRLGGVEVAVQPRVFDLLTYLVRHRDRVVGKDELLDTLWPGMVVADGALQRAVSVARSALRAGGMESAIRTYARRGYRFCGEAEADAGEAPADAAALDGARTAHAAASWEDAARLCEQADRESDLGAADLERWAFALQCVARPADAVAPLERAVAAYGALGERRGAARAATMLAHLHLEARELAVAKGWLRRAARLLEGVAEGVEHGQMEWIASRLATADGRPQEGADHGERALGIARALGDADLEAVALVYTGHALITAGEIEHGVALQDEAAAAVLAGSVSPMHGGLIYCSVIYACVNRADWRRAAQWTDQFTRWCERNGLFNYPGLCRMHRAEVLSLRGELEAAEAEIGDAITQLAAAAPYAEGDGYRVLGEIRLARGDLAGAETAFRRAVELGWDPQPGYALLQIARGRADSALRALERSLDDPGWASRQRRGQLLANLVIAAAAGGDVARAGRGLQELEGNPSLSSTPALAAMLERARAEVAVAGGRVPDGIGALRRALRIWTEANCPLNIASTRLRLAQALVDAGDTEAAELELFAAQAVFREVGATAMFRRCEELRSAIAPPARDGTDNRD